MDYPSNIASAADFTTLAYFILPLNIPNISSHI